MLKIDIEDDRNNVEKGVEEDSKLEILNLLGRDLGDEAGVNR